jgi:hypothetical protein
MRVRVRSLRFKVCVQLGYYVDPQHRFKKHQQNLLLEAVLQVQKDTFSSVQTWGKHSREPTGKRHDPENVSADLYFAQECAHSFQRTDRQNLSCETQGLQVLLESLLINRLICRMKLRYIGIGNRARLTHDK